MKRRNLSRHVKTELIQKAAACDCFPVRLPYIRKGGAFNRPGGVYVRRRVSAARIVLRRLAGRFRF